jgi:hypothetical protein
MLTPYLLTEFHGFNVYLISGTRNAILNFSRDQRGNSTKYQKGDHYSLVHTEEHTWTEDWTRTTQKVGCPPISGRSAMHFGQMAHSQIGARGNIEYKTSLEELCRFG